MHTIRRSCQFASQQALRLCTPLNGGARRAFSQSPACHRGSLPQFLESSSPELGTLLAKLNSKVLLPEHLTKEQAQLVYKQENRARLEAEPIEITLGDVTLPLEHIDRNRDRPSRWHTIKQIVEGSNTPEDFENVLRMMEGFRDAGIKLKPGQQQKIVRRLHQNDMHHLVLKALQRSVKTGLRLRNPAVALQVLEGLHTRAALSEWDEVEVSKMLKFAEQVVEMMEEPEHLGHARPTPGDLRASPFVIAQPLELAAVRAKKHTGGQDVDGKVKKYAVRLMNALQQGDFLTVVLPRLVKQLETGIPAQEDLALWGGDQVNLQNKNIQRLGLERVMLHTLPLWNALKTASQVLGSDMPSPEVAQKTAQELRAALAKAQAKHQQLRTKSTPTSIDSAIEVCEKL